MPNRLRRLATSTDVYKRQQSIAPAGVTTSQPSPHQSNRENAIIHTITEAMAKRQTFRAGIGDRKSHERTGSKS